MGLFSKRGQSRYDEYADEGTYDDYNSRRSTASRRDKGSGPRPGRPWGKVIVIRKGDKPDTGDDYRTYRGNDERPLPRYERARSAERYYGNGSQADRGDYTDYNGSQRFIPISRKVVTEQPATREVRREIVPVERTYVETKPAVQREIIEVAPVTRVVEAPPPPPPPPMQREIVYVTQPPPPPRQMVVRREEPEYVSGRLVEMGAPREQRLVPVQTGSYRDSQLYSDREMLRSSWVHGPQTNYVPLHRA